MTQAQFDALIDYINARAAYAAGRGDGDRVAIAHRIAEDACVTEQDV